MKTDRDLQVLCIISSSDSLTCELGILFSNRRVTAQAIRPCIPSNCATIACNCIDAVQFFLEHNALSELLLLLLLLLNLFSEQESPL